MKCSEKNGKHKTRDGEEYRELITRLNRIEGQVRGIKGMVDTIRKLMKWEIDETANYIPVDLNEG